MLGAVFSCLLVRLASSMAVISPVMVTTSAASFRRGGIVIIWVFVGIKFEVIIRPAIILPQARRLIGFSSVGSFSLIGDRGKNRGCPIDAKKIIRKLYTAVKDVANRVRVRAQAFNRDVFNASIMASFEKKPARKGVPVRAKLPMVMHEDVNGMV